MADDLETLGASAGDEGPESLLAAIWRLLQSVRTTIWVLPVLAVATTIGAVIPQRRPADYYDIAYGSWGRILTGLGFDDVYNSTWFIILVCVLLANLAACVARSFRRAARRYRGPEPETLARKLAAGGAGCWQADAPGPEASRRLGAALHHARYAVTEHEGGGGRRRLLVRRWPLAHYGGIVTHLAIFAVAVGAVLGRLPWTSLDRQVTIVEGETQQDADGKLGCDIRLDDFRMDYYRGTDQPSSYESDVVLLSGGSEVARGTATVNRQVVYHGLALGQASWGLAGVRLTVKGHDGREHTVRLALSEVAGPHGESAWAFDEAGRVAMVGDDGEAAVAGVEFVPDTQSGSQYPKSPAVSVQLATGLGAKEHSIDDLGLVPQGEERTVKGYTVRFDDLIYVSTLSARRDPGLPLVWIGFILVSLGMAVMFYVRPRAFLIEVDGSGEAAAVRVALAGRELAESDRRLIESACEARLAPMAAAGKARGRRRAST